LTAPQKSEGGTNNPEQEQNRKKRDTDEAKQLNAEGMRESLLELEISF
jgi:hypothetical protein